MSDSHSLLESSEKKELVHVRVPALKDVAHHRLLRIFHLEVLQPSDPLDYRVPQREVR